MTAPKSEAVPQAEKGGTRVPLESCIRVIVDLDEASAIEELANWIECLQSELAEATKKNERLQACADLYDFRTSERNEARDRLAKAEAEIARLNARLLDTRCSLEDAKTRCSELRGESEDRARQIIEKHDKFTAAKEHAESLAFAIQVLQDEARERYNEDNKLFINAPIDSLKWGEYSRHLQTFAWFVGCTKSALESHRKWKEKNP